MRDYISFEDWQKLKAEKGDSAFKAVGIQCISGSNRFKRALNSCGVICGNKAVDAALSGRRNVMVSAFLGDLNG